MELHPPPLETLLELGPSETVPIEGKDPRLDLLLAMVRKEPLDRIPLCREGLAMYDPDGTGVSFPTEVILRRLAYQVPDYRVSGFAIGLASATCGQNPGRAVLWTYALAAVCARGNGIATLRGVLDHLDGRLPTVAGMHRIRDAQKVDIALRRTPGWKGGDNWVDQNVCWTPEALCAGAKARTPVKDSA